MPLARSGLDDEACRPPRASGRRPAACRRRKRPSLPMGLAHRQVVALADGEVLLAVRGGGVHRARARLQRHVIAEDHRHLARPGTGCCEQQPFERAPGPSAASRAPRHAVALRGRPAQRSASQDQPVPPSPCGLDQHVVEVGAAARRPGWPAATTESWSRSRCRRASRPARRHAAPMRAAKVAVVETRNATSMAGGGVLLVFHFGLGQRRAAVKAPVDGLHALVEMAVGDDAAEDARSGAPRTAGPWSGRDGPSPRARPSA